MLQSSQGIQRPTFFTRHDIDVSPMTFEQRWTAAQQQDKKSTPVRKALPMRRGGAVYHTFDSVDPSFRMHPSPKLKCIFL